MHSEDFWIQVHPSGTPSGSSGAPSFVVHTRAPSGQTLVTPLHLPTREKLDRLAHAFAGPGRRDFSATGGGEDLREVLRGLGDDLFEEVFRGEGGRLLGATVGRAGRPKKMLRLLVTLPLDAPGSGSIQELPWEALWYRNSEHFLALVPGYSIVRHLDMPMAAELPPRPEVLRVLALAADDLPGLPPLRLDREARALRDAFATVPDVRVDVEPAVPVAELSHLLEEHRPHVFHFMGHGDFDEDTRQGVLCLPDGRGGVERVEAERLLPAFSTAAWRREEGCDEHGPGLQLVVLNACRTAQAVAEAPLAGVATALVRRGGVPAVLAMQYPVRDEMATVFSTELYRRIARGHSLEEAVFHGRLRIYERGSLDWVAPALFSRLPGGQLFEEARVPAAAVPVGKTAETAAARETGPEGGSSPPPAAEPDPIGRLPIAGLLLAGALALLLLFGPLQDLSSPGGGGTEGDVERSEEETAGEGGAVEDGASGDEGGDEDGDEGGDEGGDENREQQEEDSAESGGSGAERTEDDSGSDSGGDSGGGSGERETEGGAGTEPPPRPPHDGSAKGSTTHPVVVPPEPVPAPAEARTAAGMTDLRIGEPVPLAEGVLTVGFFVPGVTTLTFNGAFGSQAKAAMPGGSVEFETSEGPLRVTLISAARQMGEARVVIHR